MDHHLLAIRVFNRVVETGGFTRAAESLGMPKATVTKLIQNLEDHLQTVVPAHHPQRVGHPRR